MFGVYDLAIHLDNLKNIDLFRQGLYGLRCSVFALPESDAKSALGGDVKPTPADASVRGLPYHILHTSHTVQKRGDAVIADPLSHPPAIDDDSQTFRSQCFRVQYCEQDIPLNDACLFRIEIRDVDRHPVFVQFELLFAEYSSTDHVVGKVPPTPDMYGVVSTRVLRLADIYSKTVHAFYPLTFDDQHFCLVNVMIHCTLVDFRFRPPSNDAVLRSSDAADPIAQPPPATLASALFVKPPSPNISIPSVPYSPAEIRDIADRFHSFYLQSLIMAYSSLQDAFTRTVHAVIPDTLVQETPSLKAPDLRYGVSLQRSSSHLRCGTDSDGVRVVAGLQ